MPYPYSTPEFGLDEQGLHRLRSRFVFESLPYAQLGAARVRRGRTMRHWPVLLLFGLLCLSAALYTGYHIITFLGSDGPGSIDVHEVVVPVIPALLGGFAIWQALRVADILEVQHGRRRLVFPLDHLQPAHAPGQLQAYIDAQLLRARTRA